jgi:hypothetical protein
MLTSAEAQISTATPIDGFSIVEKLKMHFGLETSKEVFQKAYKGEDESRDIDTDEARFIDRDHDRYESCGTIPCYVVRAYAALSVDSRS